MSPHGEREPEAVGLRYTADAHGAPRVVARGRGELARRILEIAEASGVPVRHDPDLLELLAAARLGDEIPEDLYLAVAEVLAFLWRTNEAA
jgi:flagellar biosynthesis protein